jgi:uncharacterized membrane protein
MENMENKSLILVGIVLFIISFFMGFLGSILWISGIVLVFLGLSNLENLKKCSNCGWDRQKNTYECAHCGYKYNK